MAIQSSQNVSFSKDKKYGERSFFLLPSLHALLCLVLVEHFHQCNSFSPNHRGLKSLEKTFSRLFAMALVAIL